MQRLELMHPFQKKVVYLTTVPLDEPWRDEISTFPACDVFD
jgi:hypothetical protein